MISKFLLLIIGFVIPSCLISQQAMQNNAFGSGEKLTYKLSYYSSFGEFNAGKAIVKVQADSIKSKKVYHFTGTGETNNFFDVLYKVRDKFQSKIDTETMLPYSFIRNTREGNYSLDDTVYFNREINSAISLRKTIEIPPDVFDIVSAVYSMRTLSVEDFGPDSAYYLNFYLDDSVYHSVIRYEGKGVLNTEWGYLPCLKVRPMLATGEVFTNRYPMIVWITDDENHVPVLGESEIVVGSVKMELSGFEGLKHPFIKPLSKEEVKKLK